jgi:hypothetical protein
MYRYMAFNTRAMGKMSIDLSTVPGSTGGTAGPVRFEVSYGQKYANASAPAMVVQMFAHGGGSASEAISELAHIMRTGQHKGGMASLAIASHAIAIAAEYGLTDKLRGGAVLVIDLSEGRYSGGVQASVRARIGGSEFVGRDPYAPEPKPVRSDTIVKIEVIGGRKAEITLPAQGEFDRLRAVISNKIQSGVLAFPAHFNDRVAARVIKDIVHAGQVEERRDELIGAIGAMIRWLHSDQVAAEIAGAPGKVIFVQIGMDGPVTTGSYSINSHT